MSTTLGVSLLILVNRNGVAYHAHSLSDWASYLCPSACVRQCWFISLWRLMQCDTEHTCRGPLTRAVCTHDISVSSGRPLLHGNHALCQEKIADLGFICCACGIGSYAVLVWWIHDLGSSGWVGATCIVVWYGQCHVLYADWFTVQMVWFLNWIELWNT